MYLRNFGNISHKPRGATTQQKKKYHCALNAKTIDETIIIHGNSVIRHSLTQVADAVALNKASNGASWLKR
jgi:hypothetical protein